MDAHLFQYNLIVHVCVYIYKVLHLPVLLTAAAGKSKLGFPELITNIYSS